jgi:hypothetical protein
MAAKAEKEQFCVFLGYLTGGPLLIIKIGKE